MSLEEYLRLVEDKGFGLPKLARKQPSKKTPRKGTPDPKMSRALVKANKMGRKKAGGYKKGWNQGKIMRKAHQLRRKM
jgi:hypothetical protein